MEKPRSRWYSTLDPGTNLEVLFRESKRVKYISKFFSVQNKTYLEKQN